MEKQQDVKLPTEGGFVDAESQQDPWYEEAVRLREGLPIRGLVKPMGEGVITLDIVPEPARRDINKLGKNEDETTLNLERILDVGGVPEDMWPTLIDSLLDWTDRDDQPRRDGAETEEHYATLDPPYKAKNGPLDTVEELLLVKGFNRTILYGGALESGVDEGDKVQLSGIDDLLTTDGADKVNVNAASPRVLMTIPGVDEVVAGAIVEEREGLTGESGKRDPIPFKSPSDFAARMQLPASVQQSIRTDSVGTTYRVTSVGVVGGVSRTVWCIATYAGKGKRLNVARWREED
jgi:hypothetical protein